MNLRSLALISTLLVLLMCLLPKHIIAQDKGTPLININVEEAALKSVLEKLKTDYKVDIFYMDIWVENIRITANYQNISLEQFLKNELERYNFTFQIISPTSIILLRNPNLDIPKDLDLKNALLIGNRQIPITGENVTISGSVVDGKTDQALPGARIYFKKLNKQLIINQSGSFETIIPSGVYEVEVSFIGYETGQFVVKIHSQGRVQFKLYESTIALQEVVVEGLRQPTLDNTQMSKTSIGISTIKRMPPSLGEVDIIKTISLLPGVTNVGEGSAGFNVRGGNVDQNLILMDDAPVFNSAHLLGFYSIFNEDVIQSVEFYRGGVPAQYGGRASSVLSITKKEGNKDAFKANGGIGTLSSRINFEGPIVDDKTSYQVGLRASHLNWILKRIRNSDINRSSAAYYDGSAKVTHQFNEKSKLSLSLYHSNDDYNFVSDTAISWTNTLATLKYNRIVNENLSWSSSLVSSIYNYNIGFENPIIGFDQGYTIDYKAFNYDANYLVDRHQLTAGVQINRYLMNPGYKTAQGDEGLVVPVNLDHQRAWESSLFIQDDFEIFPGLKANLGLRLNHFMRSGSEDVYKYQDGVNKSRASIVDTINYKGNQISHQNLGLEPRFSLAYQLNPVRTIKFNYSRMRQNLHLISNTSSIQPIDIWQMSNRYIAPQVNQQFSTGYFTETLDKNLEVSTEIFYKQMNNVLDYKDGAELLLNPTLETEIVQGQGTAFGGEVLLKKNTGKVSGWISYSYTNTRIQFNSPINEENINNGINYPPFYDKPHALNIVANYQITRRYSLSANFVYSTGRPFTAPTAKYQIDSATVLIYSGRNEFRIPDYHRLDLALKILPGFKRKQPWRSDWTIAVYNVYGRRNAFSVFFKPNNNGQIRGYQLSLIGAPIPTITYNFYF